MLGQVFRIDDLAVVAVLVGLEALLSADNALVLAIMARRLPKKLQKKALLYGLGGAFIFRLIAIVLAGTILRLWWLQGIGALYLVLLAGKHLAGSEDEIKAKEQTGGFWKTVIAIEIADIAFAIDSVLAGVAMVKHTEKLWVVYTGAMIGIILLRLASLAFIRLLHLYPFLEKVAYLLVGWVGVELGFLCAHNYSLLNRPDQVLTEMSPLVFWGGMGIIGIGGSILAVVRREKPSAEEMREEALVEEVFGSNG
ncbi:MAG: hypothetical protein JSS72_00305 [Armatimonadetes bacterium]|nr:hypothetical protein [Armatimonadota bacterium]